MTRVALLSSCLVLSCLLALSAATETVSVDAVTAAMTALVTDQRQLFQDVAQGTPAAKSMENVLRSKANLQGLAPATKSVRQASACTGTLASGLTFCTVINGFNVSFPAF